MLPQLSGASAGPLSMVGTRLVGSAVPFGLCMPGFAGEMEWLKSDVWSSEPYLDKVGWILYSGCISSCRGHTGFGHLEAERG